MKKFLALLAAIALVVGVVAYLQQGLQKRDELNLLPPDEVENQAVEPAGPRYPIPVPPAIPGVPGATPADEQAPPASVVAPPELPPELPPVAAEPIPELNDSNAVMTEIFATLFGGEQLQKWFNTDELIRRFVVTVDNLPERKLPRQQGLLKPVPGAFLVSGAPDALSISPENAARYASYVAVIDTLDARQWVAIYVRYYPLFQAAYAELGRPGAYFNDRLVEVIDHLLDMPATEEPLPLVQPKVFYLYADQELEALSAGQKILLRMGSANAARVQARLREIRALLTGVAPGG